MNSQPETGDGGGGDSDLADVCGSTMGLNDQLDSSPKSGGATPLDGTQHKNTGMHIERMDGTQIGGGEEAVLDGHSLENSEDNANCPQAPPVHGEARRDLHNTPTELRDVYDEVKTSGRSRTFGRLGEAWAAARIQARHDAEQAVTLDTLCGLLQRVWFAGCASFTSRADAFHRVLAAHFPRPAFRH